MNRRQTWLVGALALFALGVVLFLWDDTNSATPVPHSAPQVPSSAHTTESAAGESVSSDSTPINRAPINLSEVEESVDETIEFSTGAIRVVDVDYQPVGNASLMALGADNLCLSNDGGILKPSGADNFDYPVLVSAPGMTPELLETFSPVVMLFEQAPFRALLVDSLTGEGVPRIRIVPHFGYRGFKGNFLEHCLRSIGITGDSLGLTSVTGFDGRFELSSYARRDGSPRLELYEQGILLGMVRHDGGPMWGRNDRGEWVIPIHLSSQERLFVRYRFDGSDEILANREVEAIAGFSREMTSTDARGIVVFHPIIDGRHETGEVAARICVIQVDEGVRWASRVGGVGALRIEDALDILVDRRKPRVIFAELAGEQFEYGLVATDSARSFQWPPTNLIRWTNANGPAEEQLTHGVFGELNKLLLRHAESGIVVDSAFALPGEAVKLHGTEIGNVEFRATRAGEPVSVDWEVVPRGRLEELSYGSFDGLSFSGETVERSLPFGEYLIRARLGGALVSREVVVVEQESTIVLAEVSPKARVVELSIVGSISGPRPLVSVEVRAKPGGRVCSGVTGRDGEVELFLDGRDNSVVHVAWPIGLLNEVSDRGVVSTVTFTMQEALSGRTLVVQEGRLRVQLSGISGAGELEVSHASIGSARTNTLTIHTGPELELLLPLGSGRVRICGAARSQALTAHYEMDSPGGANCELDCGGGELIPVLVSVEGAWYFEGRIQTEVKSADEPIALTMFPLDIYEVRPPTSLTIASSTAGQTVLVVRGVMHTVGGGIIDVDTNWPVGTAGYESGLEIRIQLKDGVSRVDVSQL